MSKKMKPTMILRWAEFGGVETTEDQEKEIPRAATPAYYDCDPDYYRLQQYWQDGNGSGEWRDISVEYLPLTTDAPTCGACGRTDCFNLACQEPPF